MQNTHQRSAVDRADRVKFQIPSDGVRLSDCRASCPFDDLQKILSKSIRQLITLVTKSTGNLVFDAPARMVVRSEIFLRGGARDHAPCCVKGRKNYPTAIFKAFSKNARIGDRSGYRAFSKSSNVRNSKTLVVGRVRGPGSQEPYLPPLRFAAPGVRNPTYHR